MTRYWSRAVVTAASFAFFLAAPARAADPSPEEIDQGR
jgi:hypothetical protein